MACLIGALVADTLVHAPLVHWAKSRAQVVALDDGRTQLTFSELNEKVQQEVIALQQQHAPATVFVDEQQGTLAQMVHLLAISAAVDALP